MRFVIQSCLLLMACATSKPASGSLAAPQVEHWPDGWKACTADETKEQLAAPPLEPEESCGLGHAGCAALRAALAPCAGLSPRRLTLLASTDGTGAVSERCLAAADAPAAPQTLACISKALQEIGAASGPSREQAPVRIELTDHWAFVADGTGLLPAAVEPVLAALPSCGSGGGVLVAVKIGADGSPGDVAVRSTPQDATDAAACVTGAFAKLKFPAHATASDDPYVFKL